MSGAVLVVDDDPGFRNLARQALTSHGLVVAGEADSVATALSAAKELRPGAMLIDVGLPDGNGLALARELAALPWRPRIVLTSTDPDAASPSAVQEAGVVAFIPKVELPDAPLSALLGAPPVG